MKTEDKLISLEWSELIRRRPGMFVGKCGDGTAADDAIYVLFREIINNSVDEFRSGYGKKINIDLGDNLISIRDFGRGIDSDRLVNFDKSLVFANDKEMMPYHTVGCGQLGLTIVNALSSEMVITSYQRGLELRIVFSRGKIITIGESQSTKECDGLRVTFVPDNLIFGNYTINREILREMLKVYAVCNPGLRLNLRLDYYYAPNGMLNLLEDIVVSANDCTKVHIIDPLCDIAIATTTDTPKNTIISFVNGHPTPRGGTHVDALREVVQNSMKKNDNLIMCINIKVETPEFNSSFGSRLVSDKIRRNGETIKQYISRLFY